MQNITIYDYLLLPLYLFLFYFIIKIRSKKYAGTPLKKYFITAFYLHMAGSLLYAMVVQYYYGYGDSFGFYYGSNFIRNAISNDGSLIKIFFVSGEEVAKPNGIIQGLGLDLPIGISTDSNFMIMKISALVSYISFNSYLIISLFFGLFSFAGIWKLYCVFNEILENRSEKILAYLVLYTPSICFWGSGLMKDTVCIGILGFIVYFLYKIFVQKKTNIKDIILVILFFYLLYIIKSYIASVLVIAILLSYVIVVLSRSKQNIIKFIVVSFVLFTSFIFLAINLSANLTSIIEDSKSQIETFKGAYANADKEDENSLASFKGGNFDITFTSLLLRSPIAVFSTLFRPFLWESKKLIMFFSAMESLLMLLGTIFVIYKCGLLKFFYYIFTDPYIFFAFIFTVLLASVVGFTTFNFGTLARYRLPVLPFYLFMLLSVYVKSQNKIHLNQVI